MWKYNGLKNKKVGDKLLISDCKEIYYTNRAVRMIMCAGKVVWQKAEQDPCQKACQNCQTRCEKSIQCGACQRGCQRCQDSCQKSCQTCQTSCEIKFQCGACQKTFQTCGKGQTISDM